MPDGRSQGLLIKVGEPSQLAGQAFKPAVTADLINNEGQLLSEIRAATPNGTKITYRIPGQEPPMPPDAGG